MISTSAGLAHTDSTGVYSVFLLAPGRYTVRVAPIAGWAVTAPAEQEFTLDVPDLATTLSGNDFGVLYAPSTNAILGTVFNDRNRNAARDEGEEPLAGFTVRLHPDWTTGAYHQTTDSSGTYEFGNLPPGTYRISEKKAAGWWHLLPESTYTVVLGDGQVADSLDFGNYVITPGSIGGTIYDDLDASATRDSGEVGLAGWHVELTGDAVGTATTDANGTYTFPGLYPGTYHVSEVWRDSWRQTFPVNFEMQHIALGPETDVTTADFGNNLDSAFAATFRTFTYDSLALAKDFKGKRNPVKPAADHAEFTALFVNTTPVAARKLTVRFGNALRGGIASSEPGLILYNDKNTRVELTFDALVDPGDTVVLHGLGMKARPQHIGAWFWTYENLERSVLDTTEHYTLNAPRWPMPNAINLLRAIGGPVLVGLGGPHSVLHPTYKDVMKSLADKGDRLHIGVARCLDRFSGPTGKSIKKMQKFLSPTRHNNVLFAEALALAVNIRSSDLHRTPPGLGGLLYDEGTGPAMPLNGMTIREIAHAVDEFLSSYDDSVASPSCMMPPSWGSLSADTLYDRLRRINAAFSGPMDTVSFSTSLVITGTREPSETGIVRYDAGAALRSAYPSVPPVVTEVPERLELYQNYPNPFNPTTTIEFFLPASSLVTLKVYNMLGQEVASVIDHEAMEDGYQESEFDASSFGSGVYFYRLVAQPVDDEARPTGASLVEIRKMVLIK